MPHEPHAGTPNYLVAPHPAHFRFRSDLLDELCISEAMQRALRRNEEAHARWKQIHGFSVHEFPFSKLNDRPAPYRPSRRYVLTRAVTPLSRRTTNFVTDGDQLTIACATAGVFQFVFDRALEFSTWNGFPKDFACQRLHPGRRFNKAAVRQLADWCVGYDSVTGFCTILARNCGPTEKLFLEGVGGYYTPIFEDPSRSL